MTKANISVLFIGRKGDIHIETAIEFLRANFKDAQVRLGEWGDNFRKMNALSVILPTFSADEIARRVRAMTYGEWEPTVSLGGFAFELEQ